MRVSQPAPVIVTCSTTSALSSAMHKTMHMLTTACALYGNVRLCLRGEHPRHIAVCCPMCCPNRPPHTPTPGVLHPQCRGTSPVLITFSTTSAHHNPPPPSSGHLATPMQGALTGLENLLHHICCQVSRGAGPPHLGLQLHSSCLQGTAETLIAVHRMACWLHGQVICWHQPGHSAGTLDRACNG